MPAAATNFKVYLSKIIKEENQNNVDCFVFNEQNERPWMHNARG
jgi:hypothetical protein